MPMPPDVAARLRGAAAAAEQAFAAFREACEQLTRQAMQDVTAAQAKQIREMVENGWQIFDAIVAVVDADDPPF